MLACDQSQKKKKGISFSFQILHCHCGNSVAHTEDTFIESWTIHAWTCIYERIKIRNLYKNINYKVYRWSLDKDKEKRDADSNII